MTGAGCRMALDALKAYAKERMIPIDETTPASTTATANAEPHSGHQSTRMTFEKQNPLQGNLEAIYSKQATDIRRSEQARHRLIKGWTDKEPAETLLLVAVECISYMTGDLLFLEHFKK